LWCAAHMANPAGASRPGAAAEQQPPMGPGTQEQHNPSLLVERAVEQLLEVRPPAAALPLPPPPACLQSLVILYQLHDLLHAGRRQ
jgi:hypothetical protein